MIYELSVTTPAAAASAAYCHFWQPASTRRSRIIEIEIENTSATVAAVATALIRTSAKGTSTTTVTPTAASNALDTADPAPTLTIDTAWSVQPTLVSSTLPMRAPDIAPTVGSGVLWPWDRGYEIIIPMGAGVVLWNLGAATGPVLRVRIKWME